jgi:hypothetical protein
MTLVSGIARNHKQVVTCLNLTVVSTCYDTTAMHDNVIYHKHNVCLLLNIN